jgi:hypothetical protein
MEKLLERANRNPTEYFDITESKRSAKGKNLLTMLSSRMPSTTTTGLYPMIRPRRLF